MDDQNIYIKQSFFKLVLVCAVASVGGLLFGMDTGIISGALPFLKTQYHLTRIFEEMIVSAVLLGATIGTILSGYFSNWLGRKTLLLISAFIFFISSLGLYFAVNVTEILTFRLCIGFAVGIAAFNAPIYLAELAPKNIRGGLISFYQIMISTGILLAFLVDTYFTYTQNWRAMLGILSIPAVLMFFGVIFLPESPRWLLLKNRKKEAYQVLRKMHSGTDQAIEEEIKEIEQVAQGDKNGWMLFRTNIFFRKVIFLGIALQAAEQLTGINIMFYYAPNVFRSIGFTQSVAQMWGGVTLAATFVIAGLFAIFLIDIVGRRSLLIVGAILMGISFFMLSLVMLIGATALFTKLIAVGCLVVFMAAYGLSAGPVVWTLISEICPLKGRNFGMTISVSTNWITNFFIGMSFLSLLHTLGNVFTFFLLGVINLALLIIYYFYTPETKDVALELIEKKLMSGVTLKNIGKSIG